MKLWDGTPIAGLYALVETDARLLSIMALGAIDSIIVDTFFINPRTDEAPEEARAAAHLLMQAALAPDATTRERMQVQAAAIMGEWRVQQRGRVN